ncbi:DnaJ domain containing protein, related [Neospora caninum Liverpool]|uniref:DnaJ domain containing protein, related n=1 Tax=Neospora caninum (strain Liverpool) TaxID=572307 RepID=F0VGL0_NEOCL|nr:DnaJ domain containing protein, related [Neospora caninum Liverpool]CBZ52854.1 DnaJ domain containing protein, related [Neospora caninum Liverpool]|eukprot:XP_003882886.1 DnaJ domain containing protein, related [Neospora caninum Liverpool]
MSQFRDTFTKEEQSEPLLDYDDSAFMFYLCTVSFCTVLPWTFFSLKKVLYPSSYAKQYPEKTRKGSVYIHCKCSECMSKRERESARAGKWSQRWFGGYAWIEKLALVLAWIALLYLCVNLPEMKNLKTFDPFEILQVEPSATNREIKKAYRLMSLKYHPDKNVNDPTSAAKFILVAKAYQALTDPVAKANYEKYGNPDGAGNMKVGMGLPRFLVEEKYQLLVLSCFFLFLLVLLPMVFICYYQRQKKYAPNGVLVETLQFLTHYMAEGSRLKNFPEYLSASGESRAMQVEKEDDVEMRELIDQAIEPKKRALNTPIIVRNYYLILGHMQRLHHLMSDRLRGALDELLKGKHAARELGDFLKQDPEERKGMVDMNADQQLDIQAFCHQVSRMKMEATVFVEDEAEIVAGDFATCHVTLTRTNLKEGEAAGAVHAPLIPMAKYEEWWIFLVDKTENASTGGRILNFVRSKSAERVVEERIQFRVNRVGKQSVTVLAICDSYAGCDCALELEFKAYHPEEKPRPVWIHPEDLRLDEEPTLFQQMLGEMYTSSDEEESFDLDEGQRVAVKKKTQEASETPGTSAEGNSQATAQGASSTAPSEKNEPAGSQAEDKTGAA